MTVVGQSSKMWKYAGELRPGDVLIERKGRAGPRSYRVIATTEGPTATTVTVTGSCTVTGELRTMDLFLITRVLVGEKRAQVSTVPQ